MFTAIDTSTGEYVDITQVTKDALPAVRKNGQDGVLLCGWCKTKAWIRAGNVYRWHFSHWVAGDCPLAHDSTKLLRARLALCLWLRRKQKWKDCVRMEHRPDGEGGLPRPVDVWVETPAGRKFAYWVINRRAKPEEVRAIAAAIAPTGAALHWVFTSGAKEWSEARSLPKIEQECIADASEWDTMYRLRRHNAQGSLHYLDVKGQTMTTVRAVSNTVGNYHVGIAVTTSMTELSVSPVSGMPVHPAEEQWVRELRRRQMG
jgi:hypothetical protein